MERVKPIRYLFLYSRTGGGHLRVAKTVRDTMKNLYGDLVDIVLVDIFKEYAPWPISKLPEWYPRMLGINGKLYGLGFKILDNPQRFNTLNKVVKRYAIENILRMFYEHKPDVVVSFHPVPVQFVSEIVEDYFPTIPIVAVGTDLVVMHGSWVASGVKLYLVPTEEAKFELIKKGVDKGRIVVTGFPVAKEFWDVARRSKAEIREKLGLAPDIPVVLVMGGGVGFSPLLNVTKAVMEVAHKAQIVVITGQNAKLRSRIERLNKDNSLRIEGFVDNIEEWMRASDVIVTKAGPTTVAEAMVVGVPMILWGAIPYQESPNVKLVVERGAGIWAPNLKMVKEGVSRILKDPKDFTEWVLDGIVMPYSAESLSHLLWMEAGRVSYWGDSKKAIFVTG